MKTSFVWLSSAILWIAFVGCVGAAPLSGADFKADRSSAVESVQYGSLCARWRRQCAELYGWRTLKWSQCMSQPQAQYDCGVGGRYRDRDEYESSGTCADWRRQCARLYGWQSNKWYQCMGQPGAVRACAYR